MCNIHFDELAVRRAFEQRAQNDQVPLPVINPNQIHRDLYDGTPVGGIRLHFIQKVKHAMVEEALRNAFAERAKSEHRDLNQIYYGDPARDVFGVSNKGKYPPDKYPPGEWHEEFTHTLGVARGVQYDMMIEESQAGRAQ